MTISAISAGLPVDANSLKRTGAAKDFEAILISQLLQSARDEGGWLGTGDDQSSEAAFSLGEQQLAKSMAASGGLGIAKLIEQGLQKR